MKISKKERDAVSQRITDKFRLLVSEKGYHKTSLSMVAKGAGIGSSTIYNYFQSKEKILFAVLEELLKEAQSQFQQTPDLSDYDFQESLQLYVDVILERYEQDRAFLLEVGQQLSLTPFSFLADMKRIKEIFLKPVHQIFADAAESGEIVQPPGQRLLEHLFADHFHMLVYYWSKDETPGRRSTTQLNDLSLSFYSSLLKSGLLNKGMDLLHFFLRRHMSGFADLLEEILATKGAKS